jgi:PAS domain S-box-containing protein
MPLRQLTSILLVDDEARNVVALEAALASVDCNLVTAHSGREALKRVLVQDFAVVVLDVHMPGMGGFETAGLIRGRDRSHSTPIIFLTADDRGGPWVHEGYRLGAVDYIYKPFDPDILCSKVSFFVELFRKTEALEQRTAELSTMAAELERSEEHFRALIENASDVILVIEENAVIRYASPSVERTLGYSREQVSGRQIAELIHPDDVSPLQTDIALLLKTSADAPPIGRRWRHRDGSYRMLESTASNLLSTMSVAGLVIHARDVTERIRAEEQIRVLNATAQSEKLRALGQMASGIAHDLNQSFMLVASYSDLARQALVQDPPNLAELENLLTTTTQAALDGGESVKRLLLFTQAAPEQDNQPVDLSTVVREAAQLTEPRWRDAAHAAGHSIRLHIETEDHVTILGSAARLRDLLTNLIFNAIDALAGGGSIHLRVLAVDGQGVIEVTDSGAGMSTKVQERIFEPFFTTKGESGSGLGLAMVFGIAEKHGGNIEVRSAPGDGTTFRIAFPLLSVSAGTPPGQSAVMELEPALPLRILAVDDEPMMTRAVVRMLKPSGHVVSVAASGEEALAKLAEQTFDVVVSDMGMGPGMNGWDLADVVRLRWPSVRFLLATGWGAAIDPSEARAKGIEAVLAKPYHPADLLRALARTGSAVLSA